MTVNPLHCHLSSWSGDNDECRWCSHKLEAKQRRWCSGECLQTWRLHHRYFLSRQIAVKASRRKCSCVRQINEVRHMHCADCGVCEAIAKLLGREMTCDHIVPRQGIKSRFNCIHHPSNLQILCSTCHNLKTIKDNE